MVTGALLSTDTPRELTHPHFIYSLRCNNGIVVVLYCMPISGRSIQPWAVVVV